MFEAPSILNAFSAVRYVLPVVLAVNSATIFASAINTPSPIKQQLSQKREMVPKLRDSGLNGREPVSQFFNNRQLMFWPVAWGRIQANERGKNAGSEFLTRSSKSAISVVAPDKMSTENGKKNPASNSEAMFKNRLKQIFQGALLALVIVWPILIFGNAGPWGGLKKPNVADKRPVPRSA